MKVSVSRDIVVGTLCDHKDCDNQYGNENYWGIVTATTLDSSELEAIYCPIHMATIVTHLVSVSKPGQEEGP